MVSSTFTDLKEHRAALIRAIDGQSMKPVAMENDAAKPAGDLIDSSLNMVGESTGYIGVISHKYGQIPEDARNPEGLSLTELEFREAQRLGLPTLIFVMGEDHPVPKRDVETDRKKRKKLDAFRVRAKKGRIYAGFDSLEDFRAKAIQSVAELRRHIEAQAAGAPEQGVSVEPPPQFSGKERSVRYRFVRELGKGGMGVVWLGHDTLLDREVAIKSILPERLRDETALPQLMQEARAAARLIHHGIVQVYDVVIDGGHMYIVMEYVEGSHAPEAKLDAELCLSILTQCAVALDHAHARQVVHRDIKPSNVLLTVENDAKIADFGLAKRLNSISDLTHKGNLMGTPYYLSPEQVEGKAVNGWTDQYALAVVAYRWLTGYQIFDVSELHQWLHAVTHSDPVPATVRNPGLPKAVDEVLGKALAKKKEERYKTCTEFVTHLKAAFSVVEAPTVWLPKPVARAGEIRVNSKDGLKYVWIPPGTFRMGASPGDEQARDNEKPAHEVTITRGFWMGQTPVTQAAWKRVMGNNPSHFKGDDLPVECITWDEAKAYCEAVGGRLPTEAEWEYAARGGTDSARYGDLDEIAWYDKNSGNQTHAVGQKKANAYGLHDMLGNVWEWVSDYYGPYAAGAVSDPPGPLSGEYRIVRGGSWFNYPRYVRASNRYRNAPSVRNFTFGVRCTGEHIP